MKTPSGTTATPIKWVGGKQASASLIAGRMNSVRDGKRPRVHHEPFAGGASVFFFRAEHGQIDRAVLSDTNARLIWMYRVLKNERDNLFSALDDLGPLSTEDKDRYYRYRSEFNALQPHEIRSAALFLWLNRTCFNGLYRVNQKGAFNVPVGRYKNPRLPSREALCKASNLLSLADLYVLGFEEAMGPDFVESGADIYCDPPFVPLSKTASFTSYTEGSFSAADQDRLVESCVRAASLGANIFLSNHDTPDVRSAYGQAGFTLQHLSVGRPISAKTSSRTPVQEVLAFLEGRAQG